MIRDLLQDLRHGLRSLRRSPGFTAVAVGTLALGIGGCVAIFSVVEAVLVRPLPYPDSDRLVALEEIKLPEFGGGFVRPEPYQEWRRRTSAFATLAAVRSRAYNLTGAGEPVQVAGARVTANTFATFGVRPRLGRDFTAGEDQPGAGDVVILGHPFWAAHFGARPDVVGRTIELDGRSRTIVGVMPPGFALDVPVDLFTPAAYRDDDPENRRSLGAHALQVIGRLRPGVTVDQARGEMGAIAGQLAGDHPGLRGWSVRLTPLLEERVGGVRGMLGSLGGAVAFLLLIACANLAGLLLARATTRAREIAVRTALGASRPRIVRQLLAEAVLLAVLGGGVGLAAAGPAVDGLLALVPDGLPRAQEIGIDLPALLFAVALALGVAVAFGLAPAWSASRSRPHEALKQGGRAPSDGGGRLRGGLVVGELAVALVLLTGAGLLMRSFARLESVDRGFEAEGAVTFGVSLPSARYGSDRALAAFAAEATGRLSALPGVTAVGAAQALPFSVANNVVYFGIAGRPPLPGPPVAYVFMVTPGYFPAMGMRRLRGRLLDGRDGADGARVCVINEALARAYFGGDDPIGKRMGRADRPLEGEIVGVVADVRDGAIAPLAGQVPMQIYVPFAQNSYDALSFVVRTRTAPPLAATAAAVRALDLGPPITPVRPLGDLVARSIARQRFAMLLFAVFSGAALLLAVVGVYGLMSYTVARRQAEIGVRMALGARSADVHRLVLGQAAPLVAAGIAAGLLGAAALTRLLAALLFRVGARDPLTLLAAAVLLTLACALACLLPARRAARVDPMVALRSE
jgi:putative ABC transport system permease protein